jgi:hypothetical protein
VPLGAADGAFVRYLLSDDTRMPAHELLRVAAHATEDYDVYLPSDDLPQQQQADDDDDGAPRAPVPPFDAEVRRCSAAVTELNRRAKCTAGRDADYGVTLSGAFGTCRDAAWATMNGTLRCYDVRDVFAVLRCSTALQRDLRRQLAAAPAAPPLVVLRKFLDCNAAHEFRCFVDAGAVVGVCQRAVDQVLPALALLTDDGSRRLAALLGGVVADLVRRIGADNGAAADAGAEAAAWRRRPSLLVDLLHEGGTLPVHVLGVTAVRDLRDVADVDAAAPSAPLDGDGDGDAAAADPMSFRLFRSYAQLRGYADDHGGAAPGGVVAAPVLIAREHDHLCGDARLLTGGAAMPVELQHPEWFDADPNVAKFLRGVAEQQNRDQQ